MKTLFQIVLGLCGVFFLLLVALVFLVLRPEEKEVAPAFSAAEMRYVMSATGKLSGMMFRGLREPKKMFTVTLNSGETDAVLASVRHLINPNLDNVAVIRSIKNCDGKIVVEMDLSLGLFRIPFAARGTAEMTSQNYRVAVDSWRAGSLPLPPKVLQTLADDQMKEFFSTVDGKILQRVVRRIEFFPDGSSQIDATAEGFRFLRNQLFTKLPTGK